MIADAPYDSGEGLAHCEASTSPEAYEAFRAERESDPAVRKRLLTFVVVGGGPTGVEMAGSIAELAHQTLHRDFRSIDPASARIVLVEGHERVLPPFL